ncbi:MAG TPA: alpha/beta fold hydrolase [Steroidobacter sp.]
MTQHSSRPRVERLSLPGPVGPLEALVETPIDADGRRAAVICHPHPLHGGTMTNKVVHMLAKAFNERSVPTVRFNYRGVGASAGSYAQGDGETEDALAVLDWASERWPGAALWLGGFSFGGSVAIRAAAAREVERLVTVAPAVEKLSVDVNALPHCPWLLIQGDRDELVDPVATQRWAASLSRPPELKLLAGVDHFFHGRLNDLRAAVLDWLERLEER